MAGHVVLADTRPRAFALLLSGSSKKVGQERFADFQEALQERGVSSLRFDYRGCGRSAGSFNDYSLADRIDDAMYMYRWLQERYGSDIRIYLCGTSIGAYVAAGAAHEIGSAAERLMLVCAAAYAQSAHAVRFGEDFSREIRRPGSWEDSFAFQWIAGYVGDLLLISAEDDEVVPKEIPQAYLANAANARSKAHVVIPEARHSIAAFQNLAEPLKSEVLEAALGFFS